MRLWYLSHIWNTICHDNPVCMCNKLFPTNWLSACQADKNKERLYDAHLEMLFITCGQMLTNGVMSRKLYASLLFYLNFSRSNAKNGELEYVINIL